MKTLKDYLPFLILALFNLGIGFFGGWFIFSNTPPETKKVYVADKMAVCLADTSWSIPGQVAEMAEEVKRVRTVRWFTVPTFGIEEDLKLVIEADRWYPGCQYNAIARDIQFDSILVDTICYRPAECEGEK
jgi:hypothetical protein